MKFVEILARAAELSAAETQSPSKLADLKALAREALDQCKGLGFKGDEAIQHAFGKKGSADDLLNGLARLFVFAKNGEISARSELSDVAKQIRPYINSDGLGRSNIFDFGRINFPDMFAQPYDRYAAFANMTNPYFTKDNITQRPEELCQMLIYPHRIIGYGKGEVPMQLFRKALIGALSSFDIEQLDKNLQRESQDNIFCRKSMEARTIQLEIELAKLNKPKGIIGKIAARGFRQQKPEKSAPKSLAGKIFNVFVVKPVKLFFWPERKIMDALKPLLRDFVGETKRRESIVMQENVLAQLKAQIEEQARKGAGLSAANQALDTEKANRARITIANARAGRPHKPANNGQSHQNGHNPGQPRVLTRA